MSDHCIGKPYLAVNSIEKRFTLSFDNVIIKYNKFMFSVNCNYTMLVNKIYT